MHVRSRPQGNLVDSMNFRSRAQKYLSNPSASPPVVLPFLSIICIHSLSLFQTQSPSSSMQYNVELFPMSSIPSLGLEIALLMWFSFWYFLYVLLSISVPSTPFVFLCQPHIICYKSVHCTTQPEVGVWRVSESGFSSCAAPIYYCRSEYFYSQHPQV